MNLYYAKYLHSQKDKSAPHWHTIYDVSKQAILSRLGTVKMGTRLHKYEYGKIILTEQNAVDLLSGRELQPGELVKLVFRTSEMDYEGENCELDYPYVRAYMASSMYETVQGDLLEDARKSKAPQNVVRRSFLRDKRWVRFSEFTEGYQKELTKLVPRALRLPEMTESGC